MLSTVPASPPPPPYDAHVFVGLVPTRRVPPPPADAWALPAVLNPGRSLLPAVPAPTPEEALLNQVG
jgi:hypothetical protein